MPRQSITDKRVLGPPTSKDNARAADRLAMRCALVRAPEVQSRLDDLAALRPLVGWTAYSVELRNLSACLDGHWTARELDVVVLSWSDPSKRALLVDGLLVTIAHDAGKPGRGRRRAPSTIDLPARSLALRAGGLAATAADERAADESSVPVTTEQVTAYRKRLRDDAFEQPPPPPAPTFVRWEDAPEWVRESMPPE